MFWRKSSSNTPQADTIRGDRYVRTSDIVNICKVDEIDLEFIRRHNPQLYASLSPDTDAYYIISSQGSSNWTIVNEYTLKDEYLKVGE